MSTFENNTFSGADESLHFLFSNNSLVQDNTFSSSTSCAIFGSYADYLALYRNTFAGGGCAIRWTYSSFWRLRDNTVPNMTNAFQHGVGGVPLPSAYLHDMDASNTLNGRPVLYVVNATSTPHSGNYSWIALANCTNITVTASSSLTRNEWGLFAFNLNDSTVYGLNLSSNQWGLAVYHSYGHRPSRQPLVGIRGVGHRPPLRRRDPQQHGRGRRVRRILHLLPLRRGLERPLPPQRKRPRRVQRGRGVLRGPRASRGSRVLGQLLQGGNGERGLLQVLAGHPCGEQHHQRVHGRHLHRVRLERRRRGQPRDQLERVGALPLERGRDFGAA
jgi:parallel beta-helix repeat protein